MASSSAASGALTKHGFPRGYRFVPDPLEIVELLAARLAGTPLRPPLAGIFHDIRILDHHPRDLYEAYKEYEEAGSIYFFSLRVFPKAGGGGKKRRPVRTANGGGWKPSGGAKQLKRPRHKGGGVVGRMVTMVFYERQRDDNAAGVKTNWGMHEFTVPLNKPDKFSDLAVYRLYKVKNGNKENMQQAAVEANEQAAQEQKPPTWTAAGYPGAGASTSNQAFVAAASTSQQEHKPLTIAQIQHFHNQYAAGMPGPSSWAVPPAATNPQDHASFAQTDHVKFIAPPPAVNPGEQQAPTTHGSFAQLPTPAASSPAPEQLAVPAMSSPPPPPAQSAGRDETMEEAPPQPEQQLLPPIDEDEYALWNGVDNNSYFTFGYSLLRSSAAQWNQITLSSAEMGTTTRCSFNYT